MIDFICVKTHKSLFVLINLLATPAKPQLLDWANGTTVIDFPISLAKCCQAQHGPSPSWLSFSLILHFIYPTPVPVDFKLQLCQASNYSNSWLDKQPQLVGSYLPAKPHKSFDTLIYLNLKFWDPTQWG